MKTKISHLGRSTVSVILAVMMLLSTMLIGTVSTVNAATNNKFAKGETIYLDLSSFTDWEQENLTMYAYFYYYDTHDSVGNKIPTTEVTDHIYSVTVPNAYCGYIKFQRGDCNMTAEHDADTKGSNNCVKVTGWDGSSEWSTYSGGSTTEKNYYIAGQKGLINGTEAWTQKQDSDKMTYNETDGFYSITYSNRAVGTYQFKITDNTGEWYGYDAFTVEKGNGCTVDKSDDKDKNISVTLNQNSNVTIKFNIDSNNNKHLYVIAESALPKVADSVTLTALSETVTSGGSTKLTATLTGKKTDTVTLTLFDGNGTTVDTKSVTTDSAEFTVTPSAETTYKVVASASGYNSVESATVTVHIVGSKTFYLFYSDYTQNQANPNEWPSNNKIVMRYEDGKYVGVIEGVAKTNNYFAINKNDSLSSTNQLWTMDTKNQIELTNKSSYINNNAYGVGDYGNIVNFRYHADSSASSIKIIFDGKNAITLADAGSTPVGNVTIKVPTVENAKVTAVANNSTTYNEGESFNINVGSSFTVNVEGENDYTLKKITYGTKTGTETGAKFTAESGEETFNVEMVHTVSNPVTVTFGSNNSDYGTVSATKGTTPLESPATVNMRDEVTIKATPSGSNYIFKSWSITGDYVIKDSKTTSDAEITLVVYSDITATASFTETSPYQVAYGLNGTLMRMNKTKYDGVYISTGTIDHSTDDKNPNSHFTIYDTANNQYASISASGYYWLKNENLSKTMGGNDSWKGNYEHGSDKGLINNACDSAKYVVYNANTKTITLTDDPDYGTKATLYVKNGTYSTSFDTGNTKEYAQSSVAAGLNATKTDPCNTYSVAFDTNVNVQTTLTDKYRKAGYYVGAYCVNGRNYTASAKNADQGIYQANITITEDLAENCVVEVTPVYYNRTIEEDNNYITLYVDADQATKDWGSTISVDAYSYKNGDKTKGELHAFGTYPGQPMVKDGQYYVIKVPRYYYEVSADGTLTIDENSPISGVTLNNYNNEKIHGSLVPIKRNMQTYDFSDFVALANKKDVKTIMFQSKFYNATGDANRNTSVVFNTAGEITNLKPIQSISNIGDAATIKVNPYEDFTDYYGRATDAIGNLLNDDQKADKDNLYIISTGSYNNQSPAYSTKGQWVTIWNVYDHNGKLITYGTPADFLNENTSQYKAIADKYKGKPVKISYEKGLSYDNGGTSRTDGRWYYSTLGQEFTSDVAIEYKHQNDKVYTADTDSNAGNNTGFVGETTKATATINNVTTASFSSVTETAHLNIKVANGWRFDGWFIKQGDKYTKVSDNYTDISTDVLMSNSYHIVARVSEIPTGTLELNHTAYTGTDPAAHTGTGFYYISAVLYDQTGAVKHSYAETQGKISIDDFAATDSLEITLKAKCHGDNTVYALYKGEAGGYTKIGDKDYEGDPSFSYTFKVSANSLFEGDKLAVNALNYYTDIVKVGGTCDITYMYKDRFGVEGEGKMVSYVVRNVELSTYEITYGYIPTDETITKYAPRIDTMYLETKWNLKDAEKVKKGRSQATVIATQTPKTCNVYYPVIENGYYGDVIAEKPYVVDYNSLLMDEGGNFLLSAPKTDENGNQFSYWDVYKANKNGGNTGELVTKCYEHNFGLRIMADYYIVPVYNEKAPTLTANINAPVLNREIYGDSANPKDKLYADLLTAFTSTAIPTFKENTTDLKVECGVFVVRNNTSTLSVDHRNTLVNAAATGAVDTTSDILAKYKMTSQVETSVKSQLEKLAVDSSVKNNTNNTYKLGSDDYRVTKFVFDNKSLTNKNRIDKVLRYTNNTANQNYIFTAYAFVVIKDSNGTVKEMKISNPQYFNLCYVGNKAL